jgi:hypothetical protein
VLQDIIRRSGFGTLPGLKESSVKPRPKGRP